MQLDNLILMSNNFFGPAIHEFFAGFAKLSAVLHLI